MKKIALITSLAASVFFFGCNENDDAVRTAGREVTITCITESEPVSKTNLSGSDAAGYYVTWASGDQIRTQSGTTGSALTVKSESVGSTSASFNGTLNLDESATTLTAQYPASYPAGKTLSVTNQNAYIGDQKYKADGPEFFPMYALANENNPETLVFSNTLGVVRVDLTNTGAGNIVVKNIAYSASTPLMGLWNNVDAGDGIFKAVYRASAKPLTLDCGSTGVTVAPGATVPFWVSAFDGEYSSFSFTITTVDDKVLVVELKNGKTFKITRSRISTISLPVSPDNFSVPLANNTLRYTTTDGAKLDIYEAGDDFPQKSTTNASTAPIQVASHTYESGVGIITFANNLTIIGAEAFKGCSTLRTIDVPSTLVTVGQSAFQDCTSLTGIKLNPGTTLVQASAFEGCTSLVSAKFGNISSMNQRTFYGCTSLTSFEIPASVTTINSYMFQNCTSLSSIVIPDNVATIQSNTFYGCTGLMSLTIGSAVTAIPNVFCKGCTSLTEITIPASVTTIGNQAFNGCSNLATVRFLRSASATAPAATNNATFNACKNPGRILVPAGTLAAYTAAWIVGTNGTGCVPNYFTIEEE